MLYNGKLTLHVQNKNFFCHQIKSITFAEVLKCMLKQVTSYYQRRNCLQAIVADIYF